jgi:hypothetical protein
MDGPDAIDRVARILYQTLSAAGHSARPWAPANVYSPPFDQLPAAFQADYRRAAAAALELPEGGQERLAV